MPILKIKPTPKGEGGTTVVANPTLEGTEPNLTGLEVSGTKYKVPEGGGSNDPYTFNLYELAHYVEGKHLNVDNFISLINQMPEKDGEHIIPYIPIACTSYSGVVYIGIRDDGSSHYFNAGQVSYPECYTVEDILSYKNEIESIIFEAMNLGENRLVDDYFAISCNMQAYAFGREDYEYLGKLTKEQLFGLFTE